MFAADAFFFAADELGLELAGFFAVFFAGVGVIDDDGGSFLLVPDEVAIFGVFAPKKLRIVLRSVVAHAVDLLHTGAKDSVRKETALEAPPALVAESSARIVFSFSKASSSNGNLIPTTRCPLSVSSTRITFKDRLL